MKWRLLLSVFVLICLFSSLCCPSSEAQSPSTPTVKKSTDSTKTDDGDELSLEWFKFKNRHPAVGVSGGKTSFARENLSVPVQDAIAIGLELGFRRANAPAYSDMARVNSEALYFTYYKGAEVTSPTLQMPESINAMRFGAASRNGYGYYFGSGSESVTFLHGSSGLSWTILNANDDSAAFAANQPLATFGSSLRFGEAWMPSIEFRIAEPVSIQLQYTWNQVYPRHMFWYWAGSGTIEAIADGLTVWFVREIAQSSPTATPIMYFLLRNGVSAAFKALRANKMNWPFNTEAPLNMHTFSLGVNVIF